MKRKRGLFFGGALVVAAAGVFGAFSVASPAISYLRGSDDPLLTFKPPTLDKQAYDTKLLEIAHVASSSPWYRAFLAGTTTPIDAWGNATTTATRKPAWPVRAAYPNYGALLPSHRIVAYYGNFYSTAMGALGEYAPEEMLRRLASTSAAWASDMRR